MNVYSAPCAASVMGNESRRTDAPLRCRNVVNFNAAAALLSLLGRRASVVLTD